MRAINAVLVGGALLLLTVSAEARSLRQAKGPAELPPSSYKAAQYIDSRGCAFIRAGFAGNVQWIPRVTRKRQVICGQTPTGVAGATKPATAQPTRTAIAATQPQTVPAPKRENNVWNWFAQPKQRASQPPRQTQQVASQVTYGTPRTKPAQAAVAAPVDPYRTSPWPIRTAPQAVHPSDHLNGRTGYADGQSVQVARATAYALPEGYMSLLDAGNPKARRGIGAAQGQVQMDLVWTQTVPRRLIDAYTGRDVTAQLPKIRYPYTTASSRAYSASSATLVAPVKQTRKKKRPAHDAASPSNMKNIKDVSALTIAPIESATAPKIAPKVTAKPIAKPVTAPLKLASHRFIQVATFGVPSNASRTVSKFNANGLPTTTRALKRGGKTYAIVLLGPFKEDAVLKSALLKARGAGFSDAFLVR